MHPDPLYSLHIFCDFDGTISTTDIGFDLFERFRDGDQWRNKLLFKQLAPTVADYWRGEAASLIATFDAAVLEAYLRTIPIDTGIHDLLAVAREGGHRFTIVSDGFDFYIEPFLAMHALSGCQLFSNHAEFASDGRVVMSFPYAADGCCGASAICKRNVVMVAAPPDTRIVYIGDGESDRCPAEHADIIFAKGALASWCNKRGLPHHSFRTLSEVATTLRGLLARRRIRQRYQAAILRKKAWEGE